MTQFCKGRLGLRSTTLPALQTAAQASPSSLSKRASFAAKADTSPSSACVEEKTKAGPGETAHVSSDLLLESSLNIPANAFNVDLNQSEYTVIDHASSPVAPKPSSSNSPFRTTLSSLILPTTRPGPSGLSLSLKSYHKSPLRPTRPSGDSRLQPLAKAEGASEFKPSESARPAFLASLLLTGSLASSPSTQLKPSGFQPPSKPRSRPAPKAHGASRAVNCLFVGEPETWI
ncbi:hypothetical protein PTTG_00783 [Puccinia triticina 1-1 BBBD Race 1]|uniref:Uncharacterized protein n=1 Tax=Puccinia triticina (isolate 1-1 / race 1 (BBBD)) TaxID=630390 RepID=A0A0C4EJ66_PUCT1|nr:hypothetical protein PTTG_00783 [Puccinia triticina 1-1 BBBD Race 1]